MFKLEMRAWVKFGYKITNGLYYVSVCAFRCGRSMWMRMQSTCECFIGIRSQIRNFIREKSNIRQWDKKYSISFSFSFTISLSWLIAIVLRASILNMGEEIPLKLHRVNRPSVTNKMNNKIIWHESLQRISHRGKKKYFIWDIRWGIHILSYFFFLFFSFLCFGSTSISIFFCFNFLLRLMRVTAMDKHSSKEETKKGKKETKETYGLKWVKTFGANII